MREHFSVRLDQGRGRARPDDPNGLLIAPPDGSSVYTFVNACIACCRSVSTVRDEFATPERAVSRPRSPVAIADCATVRQKEIRDEQPSERRRKSCDGGQ